MASSSRSSISYAPAVSFLIVVSALMLVWSSAHADPAAPDPSASQPAAIPTPASSAAELTSEIQVQLARIVPAGMRIDGVMLGCKPPVDATLKTVAPGITSLTSRSFMVELQEGDRSLYCSASMNASRLVLTAVHDLEADAPVSDNDIAVNWVDAFSTAPGALASFPAEGAYVTATPLRAGQPLYQNALKHPIAIHPGDLVTVLVKNGPVTVRAQLQAQTQASIGDTATMINPASGAPVNVTVTGPKFAEMVMQ